MYCPKCGKQLPDDSQFCPECRAPVNQTPAVQKTVAAPSQSVNAGFCVLSVFFPVVGLIFFIVWQKEKPRQAKFCGICALVAFIVAVVVGIILGVLLSLAIINSSNWDRPENDLPGITRPDVPDEWGRYPEDPAYDETGDGVLTFAYYGKGNEVCYDNLTDSVIVWNISQVDVYGRTDNGLRYSFVYTLDVSTASAYNGILCVGFGSARQISVVNLQTGESRTVMTEINVDEIAVTEGLAVFGSRSQSEDVGVLDLNDCSVRWLSERYYMPKFAVNHEKRLLYVVETNLSSCDFCYVNLETLSYVSYAEFSQYSYNSDGVYYDGVYVHAFGNTYNATNGRVVAERGYAEKVSTSSLYPISTLCRNGRCSLITEYDNQTIVFNNKSNKIVRTLKLSATEIYHVGESVYLAVCGDSGYVGHLDLSGYKINGTEKGNVLPGKGGYVADEPVQQPEKPDRNPQAPAYKNSEDGVLTFVSYGSGKNICYDNLTDSVIVWSGRKVTVYGRTDSELRYSFEFNSNVAGVDAYGGTMCVGFGDNMKLSVVNLMTGESKTVTTTISVNQVIVTDGKAVFCDYGQWDYLMVLDLNSYAIKKIPENFYRPKLAVNHERQILYLVETDLSSCDFAYINLNTFNVSIHSEHGEYVYNGKGVYYDGEYVHAFGNTYDAVNGAMVASRGYAENVRTAEYYLMNTLLRHGGYSFITEYDNRTVIYDNQSKQIVYVMKLNATAIYHVKDDLYFAVCGNSGYAGLIDLSKMQ